MGGGNFAKAMSAIMEDKKILLCGLICSSFESSMFIFVFNWTPCLMEPKEPEPPFRADWAAHHARLPRLPPHGLPLHERADPLRGLSRLRGARGPVLPDDGHPQGRYRARGHALHYLQHLP